MTEVKEKIEDNNSVNSSNVQDTKNKNEDFWNAICFISSQNRFFVHKLSRIL